MMNEDEKVCDSKWLIASLWIEMYNAGKDAYSIPYFSALAQQYGLSNLDNVDDAAEIAKEYLRLHEEPDMKWLIASLWLEMYNAGKDAYSIPYFNALAEQHAMSDIKNARDAEKILSKCVQIYEKPEIPEELTKRSIKDYIVLLLEMLFIIFLVYLAIKKGVQF